VNVSSASGEEIQFLSPPRVGERMSSTPRSPSLAPGGFLLPLRDLRNDCQDLHDKLSQSCASDAFSNNFVEMTRLRDNPASQLQDLLKGMPLSTKVINTNVHRLFRIMLKTPEMRDHERVSL
jgi:hypothetical protein